MWTYETSVVWKEGKLGETHAGGKPPIEVATPPEFGGPGNYWTPEDLLTSAVASCIMTSALFFIERADIILRSYMSNATGQMEKGPGGLTITSVKVEIAVTLAEPDDEPALRKAIDRAEATCPISRSLNCPVEVTLHVNGHADQNMA
jgi:organic hydroperoxide reductase OsmC/OhrA